MRPRRPLSAEVSPRYRAPAKNPPRFVPITTHAGPRRAVPREVCEAGGEEGMLGEAPQPVPRTTGEATVFSTESGPILRSFVAEFGSADAVPAALLAGASMAHYATDVAGAVQPRVPQGPARAKVLSARERRDRRVHYIPPASCASDRPQPPTARSVLAPYIRRPNAGRQAESVRATRDEVLNLRRVLNEVQLHIPALARQQSLRRVDLESEEGQARCFRDIYGLIDEDCSGEIDLNEFVSFGRRIGGETAKVFSAQLFRRIVKPDADGIALDPFLDLLFPQYMAKRRAQAAAEERRRFVVTAPRRWEDNWEAQELDHIRATFRAIDVNGDEQISAEELAVYALGPAALDPPRPGMPSAVERYQSHMRRYDKDGDGFIDFEEFAAMQRTYVDHASSRGQPTLATWGRSVLEDGVGGSSRYLPYVE